MRELRCVVCQHESIADSQADSAQEMRILVRERVAAGERPDEIKAFFISRYGDWVSFRPPRRPETYLLWAAPVLLIAAGLIAARRLFACTGPA